MNILIIGAGGREHTLAWKIRQSTRCDKLYLAPGNAGTANIAENIPIQVNDFAGIAKFIHDHRIDMLVVGPEVPLVEGIRDYLEKEGSSGNLKIIGPANKVPSWKAARILQNSSCKSTISLLPNPGHLPVLKSWKPNNI